MADNHLHSPLSTPQRHPPPLHKQDTSATNTTTATRPISPRVLHSIRQIIFRMHDPKFVQEYFIQTLTFILQKEESLLAIQNRATHGANNGANNGDRVCIQFILNATIQYQCEFATIFAAALLFRLSKHLLKGQFLQQELCLVCFFIASKYHETTPVELNTVIADLQSKTDVRTLLKLEEVIHNHLILTHNILTYDLQDKFLSIFGVIMGWDQMEGDWVYEMCRLVLQAGLVSHKLTNYKISLKVVTVITFVCNWQQQTRQASELQNMRGWTRSTTHNDHPPDKTHLLWEVTELEEEKFQQIKQQYVTALRYLLQGGKCPLSRLNCWSMMRKMINI